MKCQFQDTELILILVRIIQLENAEICSMGLVCGSRNAHQEVVFAKETLIQLELTLTITPNYHSEP